MKIAEKLQPGIVHVRFGTPLHQKVLRNFKERLRLSRDEMRKKREESWKESEDAFTAFVPETEISAARKAERKEGKNDYVTISVPYSYAMLLTSHTYYTSVFMARDPIFQLKGRHGESQDAETAMESLLDYQLTAGGGMAPLFSFLRSGLRGS